MKRRELKKKISEAYRSEAPDLRSKILASCKNEEQLPREVPKARVIAHRPAMPTLQSPIFRRVAAAVICLLLFVSGMSVGSLLPQKDSGAAAATAESFIYLDVNPSIELQMDAENRIIRCIASNEDAEKIIAGLSLEGVEMNTALTAIVGSMYVNGYLREDSNSILVSVDGKDEATTGSLLSAITGKINEVFENSELDCSIIAQSVKVDDALRQRAEENGVSVGKMRFVDKMIEGFEEYATEDAAALAHMSIRDLNIIYDTRPNKGEAGDPFGKDVASGHISGIVEKGDALLAILVSLAMNFSEVEEYEIKAGISQSGPIPKPVYTLLVKFKNDDTVYQFEVDCEDGGIIKTDDRFPGGRLWGNTGIPSDTDEKNNEKGP